MIYATNYETIKKQGVLPMENKVLVYTTRGNPPKDVQPLGDYVVHLKDLAPSTGLFYTYVKHLKAGNGVKRNS